MSLAEQHKELRRMNRKLYNDLVRRGEILTRQEQERISHMNSDELFSYLFELNKARPAKIYPTYSNSVIRGLEREIAASMNALVPTNTRHLKNIRDELGDKANIAELTVVGNELYTQEKREKPTHAMRTGKLEYKVSIADKIPGQRFFTTTVGGYYGILKFYLEEVARMAPEGANAYLMGNGLIAEVKDEKIWSPIVGDRQIGPIHQKDDEYHVVPIQFFRITYDSKRKYKQVTKEVNPKKLPIGTKVLSISGPDGTTHLADLAVPRE